MPSRRVFIQSALAATAISQLPFSADGAAPAMEALRITSAEAKGGRLEAKLGNDTLRMTSPAAGILRIDIHADGIVDPHTPVIDPHATQEEDPSARAAVAGHTLSLHTDSFDAHLTRNPLRLTVINKAGRVLLDQKAHNGFRVDPTNQAATGFSFSHQGKMQFYGIRNSACWTKHPLPVLRDGAGVPNDTYQVEASVEGGGGAPFVWTTDGFGILVDCDGGYFSMKPSEIEFYYGNAPFKDYGRRYFRNHSLTVWIFVGSPFEIMKGLSSVSGRMPMFPKWAYGFTNSQWGTNQELLRGYLETYRGRDISIDNFTLDFDWKDWGASHYGEFRWNPVKYSQALYSPINPDALINWTRELQCKITGIMKPRIIISTVKNQLTPMTTQGAEAKKLGIFAPGEKPFADYFSGLPSLDVNFYKPICRQWYWHATWKHRCMQHGIAGFWNDEADYGYLGNFEFLHMQQALYDGQRRDLPNRRIWSMNRNFYLGSQRYAYATWSGDINTGFAVMRRQTVAMVNTISLGQMRWAQDTGGFNGHPTPEVYTRWFQFTAVCPTLRTHCTLGERRQPWVFGDQACETVKYAIRQRYAWFFYAYACEATASREGGVGIVRPMFFAYPEDSNVAGMSHQWMFGEWIMAAPVLHELGTGHGQALSRRIYLPAGDIWIDYFRGVSHTGGQWIDYPLNAASWMDWPLFVKQGAIIPVAPPMQAIHTAKPKFVYLDIFPAAHSTQSIFYDDDGETFDYEKGAFHRQTITAGKTGTHCHVTISGHQGAYRSSVAHFLIRLHGQAATEVRMGAQTLHHVADPIELAAQSSAWYADADVYGPVTVIKIPAGMAADIAIEAVGNARVTKDKQILLATDASLSGPDAPEKPLEPYNSMYAFAHEFGPIGSRRNTIESNHAGYTGSGFIAGFNYPQTAATYYVCRQEAGAYETAFRFANGHTHHMRTLNVYVNGILYGEVEIPGLANWHQWQEVSLYLPLVAGVNSIMLRRDSVNSGEVNLDTVKVAWVASK